MPYRYLLLDIDNTLLDFTKSEEHSFREMCDVVGLRWTQETYRVYSEINSAFWKQLERGEITVPLLRVERFARLLEWEGVEWVRENGKTSIEPAKMNEIYMGGIGKHCFLMPHAKEVCEILAKKYPLYAVTNGLAETQRSRLDKTGLSKYFRKLYISEEIGVSKPDPAFFAAVLADIGDSERTHYLVVGDSLSSDIQGAAAAGMDSVWITEKDSDPRGNQPTYTIHDLRELLPLLL